MNKINCPHCGYRYFVNSCELVQGFVLFCWHCFTYSAYDGNGLFTLIGDSDRSLNNECATVLTNRIAKTRSSNAMWSGQIDETTNLEDPGLGDLLCSDAYQMQETLRRGEPCPYSCQSGYNTESAYIH